MRKMEKVIISSASDQSSKQRNANTSNKMISTTRTNLHIIRLATVCALITLNQLMVTRIKAQTDQQPSFRPSSLVAEAASSDNIIINSNDLVGGSSSRQQSSMPGHYEFEVAPNMEPPSVRRPPYEQSSTQNCPGSDPFAGFSPKDTLCGNLNDGRVPLNPLGQNINGQSYPFEVIKNKTLQFLARALPVLKLEYETIPKVARYLPGQHLLNPTHLSSPLGHEHFHRLNQRLAGSADFAAAVNPYLPVSQSNAGRRRRKRSLAHASYTVAAELSPNASLLVSSAHSAPGRIRDFMGHQQSSSAAATFESAPSMAVITKDGYRPISQQPVSQSQASLSARFAAPTNSSHMVAPTKLPQSQSFEHNNKTVGSGQAASSVHLMSLSPSQQNQVGGLEIRHQQQAAGNTPASQPITVATPSATTTTPGNSQQRNHAKATTAASGQGASAQVTAVNAAAAQAARSAAVEQQHQQAEPTKQSANNSTTATNNNSQDKLQSSSSGLSKRRSLMSCSDSANGFSSAICQAAVALIEGSERQPVWMQVMKQLGNAFAGPNEPISAQSTPANNPVWSILSGLSAVSQAYAGSNEAQSKSAGGGGQQSSSKPNLMNLIGPITSLLTGGSGTGIGRSGSSKDSNSSSGESSHKAADMAPPSFGSALANNLGSSTVAKLALAGWASNAVAGLLDYFAPSLFSSATRGFARRKKPYDPLEQFVDTPASLAALTAASSNQQQSRQLQSVTGQQSKQPPTPCPSVEEYISPTFARNYQGTWKYVIQIPHEGYFTQTIQRTSCVRQRCEFTEGVCHESPRWVSLLVAEIYYPHAVFSQSAAGVDQMGAAASPLLMQQQQPSLSASPSMSSIQQVQPAQRQQQMQRSRTASLTGQDPLQMTDSLQNYNHNLNSAFIEAANGMGLDPNNVANMQQLADSYSYQLFQRNGLIPGQQQQQNQMDSRSSSVQSNPLLGSASSQHYSISPPANQPQSQPQQQQRQTTSNLNNDYILSLAEAALKQNPNLSINDLITILQPTLSRKKRDVDTSRSPANSWSPQQQQQPSLKIQQRSSTSLQIGQQPIDQTANHPALNEIPSAGQPNQQSPFVKQNNPVLQQLDPSLQQQQQHHSDASAATNQAAAIGTGSPSGHNVGETGSAADQTECDGHDKIGCYVVRVYYDWFLVNGSCKCWKTTAGQQQPGQSQVGNSFLRRIFTG